MKVSVTAVPSTAPLGGAWRAGRKWSVEGTTVEVVDSADDPTIEQELIVDGRRQGKRQIPDPLRINRTVLAALKADSHFVVTEK